MDVSGEFVITKRFLVKGEKHVLGGAPSRDPQITATTPRLNNVFSTLLYPTLSDYFTSNYRSDPTLGDIYRLMICEKVKEDIKKKCVSRLLRYFEIKDDILLY